MKDNGKTYRTPNETSLFMREQQMFCHQNFVLCLSGINANFSSIPIAHCLNFVLMEILLNFLFICCICVCHQTWETLILLLRFPHLVPRKSQGTIWASVLLPSQTNSFENHRPANLLKLKFFWCYPGVAIAFRNCIFAYTNRQVGPKFL